MADDGTQRAKDWVSQTVVSYLCGSRNPKPKRMVPFPRGVRDSRKRISEGNLSEVSLVGVCAWAGRVYMSEDHDI